VKLLGLTGGVGMGKSASSDLLRQRGVAVVDTDLLAREVVEPGQPALGEIEQVFGPEVLDSDGRLRREELARRVFAAPDSRRRLEGILHPRIRCLWQVQVQTWRAEARPLAVVVIPLLFETNAEKEFDATLCVACCNATQRQRLLARGWDGEQIQQRISAQWPVGEKMAHADFVVWTEAGLDVHAAQLDRILHSLGELDSLARFRRNVPQTDSRADEFFEVE
jgi:dephospho-CoA kinase